MRLAALRDWSRALPVVLFRSNAILRLRHPKRRDDWDRTVLLKFRVRLFVNLVKGIVHGL